MIILGLDPGIAKFGYGITKKERGGVTYIDSGVFSTSAEWSTAKRLALLSENLDALLRQHHPDIVVIERLIPGPNRNLGVVAEARGVALSLLGKHTIPYEEVSPKSVKALATRHGGASKMQVRKTIQRLLVMDFLPKADAADALAMTLLA